MKAVSSRTTAAAGSMGAITISPEHAELIVAIGALLISLLVDYLNKGDEK